MDKYKFGEFIYQKRKELGFTQDELGYKLGVTNKAVSKWETGENLPDITMIKKLSDVLGLTVDELLSQKEISKENQKTIKSNKLLFILVIVLASIEIITLISCFILLRKSKEKEIIVTKENISEVININPISSFNCDNQTLSITSYYEVNNNYSIKAMPLKCSLTYQINYYYFLNDDTIGLITYYNRLVDLEFSSSVNEIYNDIILEPVTLIDNFKSVKNIEITYEIIDCNGLVYNLN